MRRRAVAAVVLVGEAGIGKSRLAAEFTAVVARSRGRVLLGMSFERRSSVQPFVQAIADDLGAVGGRRRRRRRPPVAALARIIPGSPAEPGGRDGQRCRAECRRRDRSRPPSVVPAASGARRLRCCSSSRPPLRHPHNPRRCAAHSHADPRPDPADHHHPRRRTDVDGEARVLFGDLPRMPAVDRVDLHGLRRPMSPTCSPSRIHRRRHDRHDRHRRRSPVRRQGRQQP